MQRSKSGGKRQCVTAVTPVPIAHDSRTLKQAVSLARAGYRSVVVAAGQRHEVSADGAVTPEPVVETRRTANTQKRFQRLRGPGAPYLAHAALFVAWCAAYGAGRIAKTAAALPAADLYVLHEPSLYPALLLRNAGRRPRFLFDLHDFYSRIEPESDSFDGRFITPMTAALERRAVAAALALTTVSDGLATLIGRAYGRTPSVVRNAHDARLDRHGAPSLRSRFALPETNFLLVTIGNAKLGQALDAVPDILSRLPAHVHWAFIGGGYDAVAAAAAQRGLGARIHLAGRLDPRAIVPAARGADLAIMLYRPYSDNYRSALPNGLFQAVAAGLPQILPPLPEIQALGARYGFGIAADPDCTEDMAQAILLLTSDPMPMAALRACALDAATALSWSAEESLFLDVIAGGFSAEREFQPSQ